MDNLPKNWGSVSVGEVFNIIGGGTPSTKEESYWNGQYAWITSADINGLFNIKPRKYVTQSGINDSTTNLVPAGSIIVVTRVGLGKVALTDIDICFSQDCQALVPKSNSVIDNKYITYLLGKEVQSFKYTANS